ncbi:MAG TPA: transcription antitermination factor NusB [Prevotellaceae bacterium]|jgi:N utilization substance protein B|nr:transcription antitermination factor NusB [Prevotellaceae bacterium]
MINRELIRLKVVQLVYTNFKNPGKSLEQAVDELSFSLNKAYDLYHYLLLIIPEITDLAREYYESSYTRMQSLGEGNLPNPRFINNRLAAQLSENIELNKFADNKKNHKWTEAEAEIQSLYKIITSSETYKEYMESEEDSYEADKNLWRKIYKKYICDNESLENAMEEWSIYWNDDKFIVDTFVLKTLNRFKEENGANQPLLEAYNNEEDWKFAKGLFEKALLNRSEYEDLISRNTHNWTLDRLPIMDVVIMVTALAEIINFPEIKLSVSFNEYINIAKAYSDPKNSSYINGLLDNVVRKLIQDNKLIK